MTAFDVPISLSRARRIRRMQQRSNRLRDRRLARRISRAQQGQVLVIEPDRLRHRGPTVYTDAR